MSSIVVDVDESTHQTSTQAIFVEHPRNIYNNIGIIHCLYAAHICDNTLWNNKRFLGRDLDIVKHLFCNIGSSRRR